MQLPTSVLNLATDLIKFTKNPYDVDNNLRLVDNPIATFLLRLMPKETWRDRETLTRRPIPWSSFLKYHEGSLGRDLMQFYIDNKATDPYVSDKAVEIEDLSAARWLKVHDLTHLVTGIPPTKEGELMLIGFLLGTRSRTAIDLLNLSTLPFIALSGNLEVGVKPLIDGFILGRRYPDVDLVGHPYEYAWMTSTRQVRWSLGLPEDGVLDDVVDGTL